MGPDNMEDFQSIASSSKIVEIENEDDFDECDDEEIGLKFKDSIMKNKKKFEEELLRDTRDIKPEEIFEIPTAQENEGEGDVDLMIKMEQLVLELPAPGDDDENRLMMLAREHMTPLAGVEGVYKRICKSGHGRMPPPDSIVTVHYNAYLEDELSSEVKPFDSTVLRGQPFSFMRGQAATIEGLDLAVGSMKGQEQSEFVFSPELAYGAFGCPPRIPPNAYVFFRIDLIEWVDSSAAESFDKLPIKMRKALPFSQILEAVKSEKRKAQSYFEKQTYIMAEKSYHRALNWIQDLRYADETEEREGMAVSLQLYLNLALVCLKNNKPKKTCTYCQEALLIEPKNTKALYRYGLAQEKLGDFSKAKKLLLDAKATSPQDSSITRALLELSKKAAREINMEKYYCQKMMGDGMVDPQKPPVENESQQMIRNQLSKFMENGSENELVFSQGLTKEERNFLQSQAKDLQLKFYLKPLLNGDSVCTVSKSV